MLVMLIVIFTKKNLTKFSCNPIQIDTTNAKEIFHSNDAGDYSMLNSSYAMEALEISHWYYFTSQFTLGEDEMPNICNLFNVDVHDHDVKN